MSKQIKLGNDYVFINDKTKYTIFGCFTGQLINNLRYNYVVVDENDNIILIENKGRLYVTIVTKFNNDYLSTNIRLALLINNINDYDEFDLKLKMDMIINDTVNDMLQYKK